MEELTPNAVKAKKINKERVGNGELVRPKIMEAEVQPPVLDLSAGKPLKSKASVTVFNCVVGRVSIAIATG
jgi:hypothetical protein